MPRLRLFTSALRGSYRTYCLLEVIRAGDVLVVIALDRLGRDTLGLLELKVLDMPVDGQDVAGGG